MVTVLSNKAEAEYGQDDDADKNAEGVEIGRFGTLGT